MAGLEDLKKEMAATVAAPVAETVVVREPKKDKFGRAYATGRRKDASARVWIKMGSGKMTINGVSVEKYFTRPVLRMIINQPFEVTNRVGQFDVVVTVTPADQTQIILHTALRAQFGEAMKQTVGELLDAQQLTALVELHDRGALDWIIRARLETALARAQEADR